MASSMGETTDMELPIYIYISKTEAARFESYCGKSKKWICKRVQQISTELKNWDNEKTSTLSLIKEMWMAMSDSQMLLIVFDVGHRVIKKDTINIIINWGSTIFFFFYFIFFRWITSYFKPSIKKKKSYFKPTKTIITSFFTQKKKNYNLLC